MSSKTGESKYISYSIENARREKHVISSGFFDDHRSMTCCRWTRWTKRVVQKSSFILLSSYHGRRLALFNQLTLRITLYAAQCVSAIVIVGSLVLSSYSLKQLFIKKIVKLTLERWWIIKYQFPSEIFKIFP